MLKGVGVVGSSHRMGDQTLGVMEPIHGSVNHMTVAQIVAIGPRHATFDVFDEASAVCANCSEKLQAFDRCCLEAVAGVREVMTVCTGEPLEHLGGIACLWRACRSALRHAATRAEGDRTHKQRSKYFSVHVSTNSPTGC